MSEQEFQEGDVVVITRNIGNEQYFNVGCKARLIKNWDTCQDVWWADFKGQGNEEGSFDSHIDGVWAVAESAISLSQS